MALSLDLVKAHLRVEHDLDDLPLLQFIEAARLYINHLGVDIAVVNPVRDQAQLLLVSTWYETGALAADIKPTVENAHAVIALLAPFRESIR